MNKRQRIFNKSGGLCWYCGNPLTNRWHIDHVEPVRRGKDGSMHDHLDTEENTVPACAACNLFKSVFTVDEFRKEIELQAERARKTSVNFRTAERFGLIEVKPKSVVFWFEKNNR